MGNLWSHPRSTELLLLAIRVLAIPVAAALLFLSDYRLTALPVAALLGHALLTTLIYLHLRATWRRNREGPPPLWWLVHFLDLLAVSLAVVGRGGLRSDAYLFYPLVGIQAGLIHGPWAGVVITSGGMATYLLALTALQQAVAGRVLVRLVYLLAAGLVVAVLAGRERQARTWAMTDFKTQLPNFRAFHARLVQALGQARFSGEPLAVVVLDLDNFKRLNAQIGHPNADIILEQVGELLTSLLRRGDFLARYGGEEFTVLIRRINAATAFERVEHIRRSVAQHLFACPGVDAPVRLTFSAGVAAFPEHGSTARQLLVAADQALLAAKAAGKNRTCLAGRSTLGGDHTPDQPPACRKVP